MILELDIGNSQIKWRALDLAGRVVRLAHAQSFAHLLLQLAETGWSFHACRVCAVRSAVAARTEQIGQLQLFVQGQILFAESTNYLAGVRNGYPEPGQLGVDRWLAAVAGYNRVVRACVIIDAGTAITVDYVRADGQHLGGMIAPGFTQFESFLGKATGLSVDQREFRLGPQTSTAGCLSAGVSHMVQGFLESVESNARQVLGHDVAILLAGGDALLVRQHLDNADIVSDLVFTGLALACPLG